MTKFNFVGLYQAIQSLIDGIAANGFVGGGDADADAVIEAIELTGVTLSSTQKTAITDRVVAFKDDGLWSEITRHYGFIGGTAAAHAINWKDPATKTITYVGSGAIHSATGITGRYSTSNYANLGPLNTEFTDQNDLSVAYYLTESSPNNNDTIMGVYDTGGNDFWWLYHRGTGQSSARRITAALWSNGTAGSTAITATEGYASILKITSQTPRLRMNDDKVTFTNSNSPCDLLSNDCYLFAVNWVNAGSVDRPGSESLGCLTFFDRELTETEDDNNRTSEVAYQTALSRN